jgi:hypothetical protein
MTVTNVTASSPGPIGFRPNHEQISAFPVMRRVVQRYEVWTYVYWNY